MSTLRKYGVGALFSTALIDGAGDPPGLTFAGPTLVAGDLKRSTDLLALGNLTAEYGAFTSGGTGSPVVGDTLTGATSAQTCVVIGYKLTSGTWAGGDAAGYIFVEQVSGAFSNENLNNTTQSASDQLTLTADFTPSIGGLAISDEIWLALTSAEMTCRQGMILIEDQAATVWAADGIAFETFGHANAAIVLDLSGANPIPSAPVDDSISEDTLTAGAVTAVQAGLSTFDHTSDTVNVANLDEAALQQIVDDLENGGRLDLLIDAIKAKTDSLVFTTANRVDATALAVSDKTGYSLTGLDAAALQQIVDDLEDAGRLDVLIDAIKAKTDNLPADPADASDIASSFSTVNSTLATIAGYIDTEIASIISTLSTIAGYIDTEVAAIKAKTDNLPSDPADASDIAASFSSLASTLATIAGYIDTEVAAIKAKTDNLPSDPADQSAVEAAITAAQSALTTILNQVKAVTDKVDDTLEDNAGTYRFTEEALAEGPGGGSGGDATAANQTTIINHLTDIKGAGFASGTDTLEEIADAIAALNVGSGAGAFEIELTIKLSNSVTVAECDVIITTDDDLPNDNVAASGRTNANGVVAFYLDAGTYYLWRQRFGYDFDSVNPSTLTVANDGSYTVT